MLAAALLSLAQAAGPPMAPPTAMASPTAMALPNDAASDARCIVVLGFIGSRGTPEQAVATKQGILYFTGKLRGRDAGVDVAATIARAAAAAKTAGLNARAEVERCGAEVGSAGAALRGVRAQVTPTP